MWFLSNLGQTSCSPKGALPASSARVDVYLSPPPHALRLPISGGRQEGKVPKQQSECAEGDMKSSPSGASRGAEAQHGEGTGPKPSTPCASEKNPPTKPGTIMFIRSLSTVVFFFLDSKTLSCLRLSPKRTKGPNLQVPVPREGTPLGHYAHCRPSAPCSAQILRFALPGPGSSLRQSLVLSSLLEPEIVVQMYQNAKFRQSK